MDLFTDIHSGLQFCMKVGNPQADDIIKKGINDYHLIKWCEQYLTSDGIFVDIGADIGTYSMILSKSCKEVWAFESERSTFTCLCVGIATNNCFNIKFNNAVLSSKEGTTSNGKVRTLDSYNLKNVSFLKISVHGSELEIIKGASFTLLDNNFPPFMIEISPDASYKEELIFFIRSLGYKVHPVNGYSNMFLAADHPLREKIKEAESKEELDISGYDMHTLIRQYTNKELDGSTPWDVWHALGRHFRMNSHHEESYDCITRGFQAFPPEDKEYMLYEELSIAAFYLGKKSEGYAACDKITFSHYAPWSVRNHALNNQSYYMQRLPFKNIYKIDYTLPSDYIASSSSLIRINDCFLMNMRAVNYSINNKGGYIIRDPNDTVRTRNWLLELQPNTFDVLNSHELRDVSGIPVYPYNILGIEDIRLFSPTEFFCSYLEINTSRTPQVCYCQFNKDTGEVTKIIPLMVGTKLQCEKNWMPFIKDDELYFIYSMSPFQLYRVNREDGSLELILETTLLGDNDFRGSSGLIPYKNGWLTTIHQVFHADPRKYFHRFVWFDYDFITAKYSEIFFFEAGQIEFNLSICHSPHGLLVPYSVNDNCCKVGTFSYDILDSWLKL